MIVEKPEKKIKSGQNYTSVKDTLLLTHKYYWDLTEECKFCENFEVFF